MMLHPRTKTLIRFSEHELSEKEAVKVATHLKQCARCRKTLAFLSHLGQVEQPKRELAPDFTKGVVANLREVKRSRQPIFAEIGKMVGSVMVLRNGEEEEVDGFAGMGLLKGYTVRLNGNSRALIALNDGSSIYLNSGTELQFPTERYPLSLRAGELLAMMKPQRRPFEIWTPAAVLGVIGTDFDTTVQDKKTTLKVLKGKVSFQNDTGKTVVKKRQQVEATKHTRPTTTRLKEIRSITNWTKPVRPEQLRGGTGFRTLGYLVILLALILAGTWYFGKQSEPAASEVVKSEKIESLELVSPYTQQGLSWRTHSNWMVTRTDIIDVDEEKGARVLLTIEEAQAQGPPEEETATSMVGRQYEYLVSPQGVAHSYSIADGKRLEYREIEFYSRAIDISNLSGIFLKKQIIPGDQWTAEYEAKMPGYPNSYIKETVRYQFDNYEIRDGVEYAVIRAEATATAGGGLPWEKIDEPTATGYVLLDQVTINQTWQYDVDVESGRVVSGKCTRQYSGLKWTITRMIKGRRVPLTEKFEQESGDSGRASITLEYLP